ncbi:Roundabout 1 [Homalodisca vitripennis]|nr:Roundabout 1 [Homalodisca vitripennis]
MCNQVLLKEDIPPPLMEVGPMNQTMPINASTSLSCQARGLPLPDIKWYKDGSPLTPQSDSYRISLWQNGTLHIEGLQLSDSGLYTCTATSASGESGWSASLVVDPLLPTLNSSLEPLSRLPPSPDRPRVVNATQTSLSVAWSLPHDSTLVTGYSLDYYSPDLQTGWVNVARGLNSTVFEVTDLKPDTSYIFVVRAESEEGLSLPSLLSVVARTLSSSDELQDTQKLELARIRLTTRPQITLTDVQAISSTAVTLFWQIHDSRELMEGLHIRYRDLTSGVEVFKLATLFNMDATSHTLTKLHKYARYQLFLVPFYKTVDGQPSNAMEVQTLEDVPSAPPQHLEVAWVNSSSAFVHWSPPPPQHCNGDLLGYELVLQDGDSLLVRTLRLNSSAMSVLVNNLTVGHVYTASLKAFTRLGPGPAARVKSLRGPGTFTSLPPQQIWLVLTAAVTAVVLVSVSAATLYLRRRNSLTKQIGHLSAVNASDLPHLGLMSGVKEALWIEVPHENLGPRKHITLEGSDYAEVDTQNLSSFYNSRGHKEIVTATPTPYATTVLVPNTHLHADSCSETGPLIIPVSSSSSGTKTSVSGDSWLRQEQNKSTLEVKDEELRCQQCLGVKDCAVPNWNDFLPPPPQHPPPPRPQGLCGSPPMSKKSQGSCSHHSRDSNQGSAVYSQCWQNSSQVPSFPSGYHTGSSTGSSCKCRQSMQPCRGSNSQENTLCSRHHELIHRHDHSHCPCCCQSERNSQRHIHTVSGERVWEDGSYSSTSCSCSEETTSLQCTFCQNNSKDCPIH